MVTRRLAKRIVTPFLIIGTAFLVAGCGGGADEITVEEAQSERDVRRSALLDQTVSRPGPPEYRIGTVGGEFVTAINNDPKTFNTLTARDADTGDVVDVLSDYLAEYDPYIREFTPALATFEIEVDEEDDRLRVLYTLRDELYWTTPDSGPESWVPVTADDIVYWYDQIEGDEELQLPGYPGQFVDMPDGSRERTTVEKIDSRTVAFTFPRIVANPILQSNMMVWPKHIFEPAKREGGVEGVLNVLAVDTDVTTIPSIGPYHIVEYSPGVRVVMQRNPNYWKTDEEGTTLPYIERVIYRIVPDDNTEYLLFRNGGKDSHAVKPEQLEELLSQEDRDYTVYNGGESLGSSFFVFNQNPANLDPVKLAWFTQTEFRQAMSSLLNRPRIAQQVYRGLAAPAHHFAATANMYFDPEIRLEYTFNPERAIELLESIGITRRDDGLMYDDDGNHIEFDFFMGAESQLGIDMANIFADEASNVGITVNVRPIDFQNLVERVTNTYDWDAATLTLGANYWPSGGSNVWQSNGNFHIWHPLQEEPATEWEAEIDRLYNQIRFTIDEEEGKRLYGEFQRILLTELPLMYTVHPFSFYAIRDKWQNVFYDTLGGAESVRFFLES
ncbi:MAG: ABC transporter substrate-binding protein [Alkalispirochaeta sp.]